VRYRRALVTFATVAVILPACHAAPSASPADQAPVTERPFRPGGRIRMILSAGAYVIEGTSDSVIRLAWKTRAEEDARKVRTSVEVSGSDALLSVDGPSRGFDVTVTVPARSDVSIDLSAGDLTLHHVEGHKDISAWAGDMKIDVGRASDYRSASASVTAGDINGTPFWTRTGGLLRWRDWTGTGRYDLRVRLTAGNITLTSSDEE
jgi:hypothetical protein